MRISRQKVAVSLFLLLVSLSLSGQGQVQGNESEPKEKRFSLGFSLGINAMDFHITPAQEYLDVDSLYPKASTSFPGINFQIITNFKLSKYFDIRFLPGFSYGERVIRYYKNQVLYNEQRLESAFLEIPLVLKYGYRLNNVKPYAVAGLNYRYDFAASKVYDEDKSVQILLIPSDLYYELGGGLDFYLTNFKFSIELKMSNGMRDIIVHEPDPRYPQYANAIEKMQSRIWILTFHFQ